MYSHVFTYAYNLCADHSEHVAQIAVMVMFGCWEAYCPMKEEWKSVSVRPGGQCAMTTGTAMMPM